MENGISISENLDSHIEEEFRPVDSKRMFR